MAGGSGTSTKEATATRHTIFTPHPDADTYNRHLLTLLARRRELQTEDVRRLLSDAMASAGNGGSSGSSSMSGGSDTPQQQLQPQPLPATLFSGTATAGSIDRERRDLQAELGLGLEWRPRPSVAESCRAAVEGAGKPLAGLPDVTALAWHFRARQAEAAVEQRCLLRHTAALRRRHWAHVAGRSLPAEVHRLPGGRHQLDHAGAAAPGFGGGGAASAAAAAASGIAPPCGCERELELAGQCMQATQLAEADAAARQARLAALRAPDDSDWWAALHWAASRLPAGRLAERFFDRVRALPLSHHHRFPLYEQVAGAALQRDQAAAASGLRVPPRVATSNGEARAQLEALMEGFGRELRLLARQVSSTSADGMPTSVPPDVDTQHHKEAYEARRILPRVLARHRRRWPGAAPPGPPPAPQPQQDALAPPGATPTAAAATAAAAAATAAATAAGIPLAAAGGIGGGGGGGQPEALDVHADDPACSALDQVHVVRLKEQQLAALAPSLEGDECAGFVAVLRSLPLQVDEVLKAENDFIDECDEVRVYDRLRSMAEQHVDRWSPAVPEEPATRMTLSRANAPRAVARLQDKTLEALHIARFLATKRNKLRVLHHLNAIVSLQLQLLRDEAEEGALLQPHPTTANKEFTCPFRYAATAAAANGTAAPVADGGELDHSWCDDAEAGIAVRDPDGRWILYGAAIDRFQVLERELLRVATYHLEAYAAQLHAAAAAGGAGGAAAPPAANAAAAAAADPLGSVDRLAVIADMWECEAQYCAARHKALLTYFQAYRHATCWGLADMWGGCSAAVPPFSPAAAGAAGGGASGPAAAAGGADAGGAAWHKVSANSPQPQLLGARRQLRREILDLTFRRPNLAREDGYFISRYHAETLALELEAALAAQLTAAVAAQERQALAALHTSAVAAASATAMAAGARAGDGGAGAGGGRLSAEALWKPGYHPGVVYGGVLMLGQRGLVQEGATLSAVGAAAASLPASLRAAVSALAGLHGLRHHVERADLRRALLAAGLAELGVLVREEAYRSRALPDRQPKDSMFDGARGRRDLLPDAALLRSNWLGPPGLQLGDNAEVLRAAAAEVGAEPRGALEAFLNKEALVRSLYRGEVLWLVYVVQARALGRKVLHGELLGIDWGQIDSAGNALKAELLAEVVQVVEPADVDPPGLEGPPGVTQEPEEAAQLEAAAAKGAASVGGYGAATVVSGRGGSGAALGAGSSDESASQGEGEEDGAEQVEGDEGDGASVRRRRSRRQGSRAEDGKAAGEAAASAPAVAGALGSKALMLAVGGAGRLGGVWRSPPLALSEFSTFPAEALNPASMAGVRGMLRRGDPAAGCLGAAVRAQALREVALEVSIRHNQVLLDGIIRKLDRRRRVLMYRAAAMEGVLNQAAMDVVVGGPPGAYAPAAHPLTNDDGAGQDDGNLRAPPPLLREPPGDRLDEYHKHRRSGATSASLRRAAQSSAHVHAALDERSLEDLRQRRRALTAAAGALYWDMNELKLRLRVQARRSYVAGLVRAKGGGVTAGPEAEAAVRAETESAYAAAFLAELLPVASRTQLAAAVRQLALAVLGGTGGFGADWGLQYDADGQLLGPKENRGPLFPGPEGQVALRAALLEYGPLWQNVHFPLADKPGDPDPMDWAPAAPAAGLPNCIGFLQMPPQTEAPAPPPQHVPPQAGAQARGFGGFGGRPSAIGGVGGAAAAAATAAAAGGASAGDSCLVRLEALWGLPGQWEVLHAAALHYASGPAGLGALERGVEVAELVVEVARHFLYAASLLAPASVLAAGGDVSGATAGLAGLVAAGAEAAASLVHSGDVATGPELYRRAEVRVQSAGASLLPGALLAADLVALQARLQYLHRPTGARPPGSTGGGAAASASTVLPGPKPRPTQPAEAVISALRREVALLASCRVLAVARTRDGFLAAGPAKRAAWYLAGSLEHWLARTAAGISTPAEASCLGPACPPPAPLPLWPSACLRLPDPDRLALHNELARTAAALERVTADCRVPAATAPLDAMALREYFAAGMWTHDRLRDALVWRSLLMEAPEAFPFAPPSVAAYTRRFHEPAPPLLRTLCPPPETVAALQGLYEHKVMRQAKQLVAAAVAAASRPAARPTPGDDESGAPGSAASGAGAAAGGREGEEAGGAAWLASSPAWGCGEVRLLEAACCVTKQQLDLQAVQTALLRLHQDCGQLAGLRSLLSSPPAAEGVAAPGPASLSAAADALHPHSVPAAAVNSLVRKLAARQRRSPGGGEGTVELSIDELGRWLAEAASQLTASARAGVAALAASAGRERATLSALSSELEACAHSLASEHDAFMRRQGIKVETQLVDRAMGLLRELAQARRGALRAGEDARRAMEAAYGAAQRQYAEHIDELHSQLMVARTNSNIMRSELQKAAVEALMEVRREMLQRAFAGGNMRLSDEMGRMLALERQLEEAQSEILDLQRSMAKVQSWFKMRSAAFLTACMREVAAARGRAEALEGELWEGRERSELALEQLTTQLRATQADLEAVSAGAARNASDLRHALASNKRLLQWKLGAAPRMEALRMKMAEMSRSREAWLEWVHSKQGLIRHFGAQLMAARQQMAQTPRRGGSGAGGGGSACASISGGSVATAGRGGVLADDAELEAIREQWELERREMQHEISRLKTELSNERLVKNDVFERLLRLEQQYITLQHHMQHGGSASVAASAAAGAAAMGGGGGSPKLLSGRSTLSPVQADILSRRYEELRSRHASVSEENAALRRTLAALRSVAPDLVASLEFPLMTGTAAGPVAAPPPPPPPHGAAGSGGPSLATAPALTVAGALRPGTAGRVRPQGGATGAGDTVAGPSSPASGIRGGAGGGDASAVSPAASSTASSPLRRGIGASGARPPSAATYALRASIGPQLGTGTGSPKRPLSSRPGAGLVAAMDGGAGGAAAGVYESGQGLLGSSSPEPGLLTSPSGPAAGGSPLWRLSSGLSVQGSQGQGEVAAWEGVGPALEVSAAKVMGTPSRPVSALPSGRRT